MSKFGAHVSYGRHDGLGAALQRCFDAGSPVPLIYSLDQSIDQSVTVGIFRTQPRINGEGRDNPPGMYVDNAIETANDWYARCKEKWLLNPATYYAPNNERNPLPEQDAWIDAFDLRLMQLADADGLRLALHGDSMGTPDYPQWAHYQTSLQHAAQHGHIITLHEPVEGADLAFRYRTVHNITEQFAPGLKIAISECYGNLGLPWDQYVDSFKTYDLEAMKDQWMIGFAAYQLGGAENWYTAINHWADWVIAHPAPVTPPPVEREFVEWRDAESGVTISTLNPYPHKVTRSISAIAITRPKVPPVTNYVETLATDGYGSVTGAGTYPVNADSTWEWLP